MRLSDEEIAGLERENSIAAQQMELMPKYLAAVLLILSRLNDESMKVVRNREFTEDDYIDITPAFVNPLMEQSGLQPLPDSVVRKLGASIAQLTEIDNGMTVCNAWDLAHGLQHAYEDHIGLVSTVRH